MSHISKHTGFSHTIPNRKMRKLLLKENAGRISENNAVNYEKDVSVDLAEMFPNLIIYFGPNNKEKPSIALRRSFAKCGYGKFYTLKEEFNNMTRVKICYEGKCLAEGVGPQGEAEHLAESNLLNALQKSCFVIQAKKSYFPVGKNQFPAVCLRADPSESDVYKVVLLKKKGRNFPHPICGAVDYVHSQHELWEYVERHNKSTSLADLFVLNANKSDTGKIKKICRRTKMLFENLKGCLNTGLKLFRNLDVNDVFNILQKTGGENAKFKLLRPGSFEAENVNDQASRGAFESGKERPDDSRHGEGEKAKLRQLSSRSNLKEIQIEEDIKFESNENHNKNDQESEYNEVFQYEANLPEECLEEIPISPWIADNLIILETLSENSSLDCASEILSYCVSACSNLEQFEVEVTRDINTGRFFAEAKIDNILVGRASGFKEKAVMENACINALINLKKCCSYIKIKQSYAGTSDICPEFLHTYHPRLSNKLYRVVNIMEATNQYTSILSILRKFRYNLIEDLFFLNNLNHNQQENAMKMGREMGFKVRRFGHGCVCVTKKRSPKMIFMDLMSSPSRENEKYKLIIPPARSNLQVGAETMECDDGAHKLDDLFDLEDCDDRSPKLKSMFDLEKSDDSTPKLKGLFDLEKSDDSTPKLDGLFDLPNTVQQSHADKKFQFWQGQDKRALDLGRSTYKINDHLQEKLDGRKDFSESVKRLGHTDCDVSKQSFNLRLHNHVDDKFSKKSEYNIKSSMRMELLWQKYEKDEDDLQKNERCTALRKDNKTTISQQVPKNNYSEGKESYKKSYQDSSEIDQYKFIDNLWSMDDNIDFEAKGHRDGNYQEISVRNTNNKITNHSKDIISSLESARCFAKSEQRADRTIEIEKITAKEKYSHPGITDNRDPYIEDSSRWRDQEVEIKREPHHIEPSNQIESERKYYYKGKRGSLRDYERDTLKVSAYDKVVDYRQQTSLREGRGIKRPRNEDLDLRYEREVDRHFSRDSDWKSRNKSYNEGVERSDRTNNSRTSHLETRREPETVSISTGRYHRPNSPDIRGNNSRNVYYQRPRRQEGARSIFERISDHVSDQGSYDRDFLPISNSDQYKKQNTRGHSFNKIS